MALSELDMMNLWAKQLRGYKSQWERLFDFGYAIEAEARRDALEEAAAACAEISVDYWMGDAQFEAATRCRNAIRKLKEDTQ